MILSFRMLFQELHCYNLILHSLYQYLLVLLFVLNILDWDLPLYFYIFMICIYFYFFFTYSRHLCYNITSLDIFEISINGSSLLKETAVQRILFPKKISHYQILYFRFSIRTYYHGIVAIYCWDNF